MTITLGVSRTEAQVTIGGGDAPAAGSVLSLNSNTKGGLVLSNVKLIDLYEIPEDFPGMSGLVEPALTVAKKAFTGAVVYNTYDSFGQGKGIYTWDGEKWTYIGGGIGTSIGRVYYLDNTDSNNPVTDWLEFMAYNLGATPMSIDQQIAETDVNKIKIIYGDLYQWGRKTDGHEKRESTISNNQVQVGNYTSAGNQFVIINTSPNDWLEGNNSKPGRWGGTTGADSNIPTSRGENDPCPPNFRVPTMDEWIGIINGIGNTANIPEGGNGVNRWVWQDGGTTTVSGWLIYPPKQGVTTPSENDEDYESTPTLFLPVAGMRHRDDGNITDVGIRGYYWSSTVSESYSYNV
ncbi:MAG: hypothetical protein LBQ84_06810, partial [Flavobacteriaceae bacterium]|nr:hypothetical protein [Flavobacteriaceae bacterium]